MSRPAPWVVGSVPSLAASVATWRPWKRAIASSFALGVRLVRGLLFDFKTVPLDAFIEVAPVLEYEFKAGRGAALRLNASAGVRYYF